VKIQTKTSVENRAPGTSRFIVQDDKAEKGPMLEGDTENVTNSRLQLNIERNKSSLPIATFR